MYASYLMDNIALYKPNKDIYILYIASYWLENVIQKQKKEKLTN